ncbi:hypothetical protein X797_003541 [Metarhizium robertsii]|uniref:Adhesion cell surface protein MAD1 n=3 Tax=Metarhizium TaxID=5529 RepID=MAD1_METAN|nr:Insect cuticle binding adhesin, Mad1 [Metarhizium robertsii ARSEF 23]Q2LC49.1 RecName: Full=Adhesion cell surface protein MAD1; AltName: Full=CFEM domain-containing cell surface protein MAD1; Flags: Precursor [Metarhizium anisopliae]AGF41720.1 adhesin-like protein 1 [Metarhizium robertsii]ABC65821.1 adhesin protein Mad1 [Metarhizium anisopliae]EFZ01179.1 Insect cuticle binding adhesin, Mad1 [Metarhizium robertsii ARSEF 23]EXV03742.1 hypothetical protein X797_003541 [Metarhizium robertsii]Q
MKSALSVVVAAAGVQQASATFGLLGGGGISFNFGLDWSGAKTFPCPGNVVNKCTPEQENGWDWSDVATGSLNTYAGFNFGGGWSCESNFGKRGDIQGRTFGLGKVISGSCDQGDEAGLSIGVGASAGIDAFSIDSFDMSTEFDARLEFHYDMPDGSVCKQTSDCKRGGSTIVNKQCGGAKKVRVIYPKQIIHKGISFSKKCKISCHKIKWHCGKPTPKPSTSVLTLPSTSTKVIQTTPVTTLQTYTTPSQQTTTPEKETTSSKETTTSAQQTTPGKETTPAQQTTPSKETTPVQQTTSGKETTPAQQTTPGKETTSSQETTSAHQTTPGKETTPAQQTTPGKETTPAQQTTPGKETTPAQQTTPGKETTPAQQTTPGQQTTPSQPTTAATTTPATTFVTTYDTTSTVYTTSTKTITSCGPEVTDCPGKTGPHIVTVTIPVSTTICPVTETRTQSQGVPTTVILPSKSETTVKEQPTPEQPTPEQPTGEKPNPVTSQPPQSTQTPPCPPVVPRCLNTFVDLKAKCADNKDASCFCPDKDFVKNIFDCIYAHGESDNIISEAISFFQGICGRYIPENPVIATGAETITQIITVTGTPHITQVPYTTVVVATTITENSSTQTISTEVTIPNIVMPTPTGGVPNQPPATASVPAGQNPPPVTGQNPPPAVTDQSPPPAITTGTGGVIPPKPTGSVPVTAGSGRVGAGLGMVLAVAAFVAAL